MMPLEGMPDPALFQGGPGGARSARQPTSGLVIGGLDVSLTSPGLSRIEVRPDGPPLIRAWAVKVKSRGRTRLDDLARVVSDELGDADVVGVEGPAPHAAMAFSHEGAGGWWVATQELWHLGIPLAEVGPGTLKKFATGNGGADKLAVYGAAVRRMPDVPVSGHDSADALWLAVACAQHYRHPVVRMPQAQVDALYALSTHKRTKGQPVIHWPALRFTDAAMSG